MVEVSQSFISKLYFSISKGISHAEPVSAFRKNESELVQGVLLMLQGFSNSLFYWDEKRLRFCSKIGIYASHLSQTSLSGILNKFALGGTCLKQVELFVKKVEASRQRAPTLRAFANSVNSWLKRLRDVALKEEVEIAKSAGSDSGMTITLLGLTNSLSSVCSGAEHLLQVVHVAIPNAYFDSETFIPAGEMAVHILDHLFKKLNEVCLVQGGEEEAYHMVLSIFMESLLPYLDGLDSWLYEGTIDDPYEEMFFYANDAVAIDQPAFWEKSYSFRLWRWRNSPTGGPLIPSDIESILQVKNDSSDQESFPVLTSRGRDQNDMDILVCPLFLKDMAKTIVSAGKSLQLVQHVRDDYLALFQRGNTTEPYDHQLGTSNAFSSLSWFANHQVEEEVGPEVLNFQKFEDKSARSDYSHKESIDHLGWNCSRIMGVLTLSEVSLVSFAGLIGDGDHVHQYFRMSFPQIAHICKGCIGTQKTINGNGENVQAKMSYEKIWFKFLADALSERKNVGTEIETCSHCTTRVPDDSANREELKGLPEFHSPKGQDNNTVNISGSTLISAVYPRNPIFTVCRGVLQKNTAIWNELNISRNFHLPPLGDVDLRKAIFSEKHTNVHMTSDLLNRGALPTLNGTDYTFGFQFDEIKHLRLKNDIKALETLYPFPTLLPCFQEDLPMSELLPFQKNSTLASRILSWIQSSSLKDAPQPAVIIKECLTVYIKKQVDCIGKNILLKLMSDWKLMDELGVLRAIYLLGSGDLLQQFLIVIFDKLDRGEAWDDDFELNTILQESIRNSADGAFLSAPDSLVVSISRHNSSDDEENTVNNVSTPHKVRNQFFGIDALNMLKFTYKVSWPLDIIVNMEALKKYNQVMGFLLKVKRAKFVLDKARRWMWKGRGGTTQNYKRHLLLEQKLLHFVDAFHQYVMDRVFHSAWIELCTGMESAGSLDEVIEVHEAYLLSVQRQCFVAPDKLWALIASRIKTILGLALDFYSIQQTLSSGGAAPAMKARCEMEVDRAEKQFDDCIAFLLRILSFKLNVGHFPHLADLVTRINYNYFYMSDTGNLLTVPNFEAKVGKNAASRTNMK